VLHICNKSVIKTQPVHVHCMLQTLRSLSTATRFAGKRVSRSPVLLAFLPGYRKWMLPTSPPSRMIPFTTPRAQCRAHPS